jgi:glycosyltransferase involved in cell wall biosynthesis
MAVRVLQLLQGLAIGGIERMVLDLVFGLQPDEFATAFCTFDREGQLASEAEARGMPLHFRRRQGAVDAGFILWLAQLLRRERIDILHAHNATAFFYGAAATTLVPGTRFLYTEHDRAFPTPLRERGLHAVLARRVDAVVTVSQTLRDNLVRYEAFPERRVHVVKNGVALKNPSRDRRAMRAELGLGERPVAGIVARLAPVKNHALLLHAWKRVVASVPDAVLLVVGNGSTEPATRALAAELELGDSVRFLGFRLDIPELLQAMDVFVLSSTSEGLSLTLLEAEAAALPIVATRVGGNPEGGARWRDGLARAVRRARAHGAGPGAAPARCRRARALRRRRPRTLPPVFHSRRDDPRLRGPVPRPGRHRAAPGRAACSRQRSRRDGRRSGVKRVLMLAYFFPPSKAAGRSARCASCATCRRSAGRRAS